MAYVNVYCIGLLAGETQRSTLSENLGQSVLSALVEYLCVLRTEVVEPSCEKHGEKEKQELPYLCLRKEEHDDVMGGKKTEVRIHFVCRPVLVSRWPVFDVDVPNMLRLTQKQAIRSFQMELEKRQRRYTHALGMMMNFQNDLEHKFGTNLVREMCFSRSSC